MSDEKRPDEVSPKGAETNGGDTGPGPGDVGGGAPEQGPSDASGYPRGDMDQEGGGGADEIRKQVKARAAEEGALDPVQPDVPHDFVMDCLRHDDLGLGMLFAEMHRGQFVYDRTRGVWLFWDRHHWSVADQDIEPKRAVENVCERFMDAKARVQKDLDEAVQVGDKDKISWLTNQRNQLLKTIGKLRRSTGLKSILEFAIVNREGLDIRGDELDQQHWLLPVDTGVVDLRTGDCHDGRPGDYMTKASPAEWQGLYEPCPNWERALLEIMDGNQVMVDFLQRLLGYGITGLTSEAVFPVFHGKGRNGKSLIVDVITEILGSGELAGPIRSEMLLDQGRASSSSGPSSDLMSLWGLRLAFASETDEGRKFSAAKVKWLSGSDKIVGRNPYDKRDVYFTPTHLLFLLTNNKPNAPASDFAFWERALLVPFELSFVNREPKAPNERRADTHLKEKLLDEASGILAWLVRGCLEWQENGLNPPPEVTEATAEYQRDEDLIQDFLDECCYIREGYQVGATDLYDVFTRWWLKFVGKRPLSQKRFGTQLTEKGFEKRKSGTTIYSGLAVNDRWADQDQGSLP